MFSSITTRKRRNDPSCVRYQKFGQLCFIVDQLNALDPEPMGKDVISNGEKDSFRQLLKYFSAHGEQRIWRAKNSLMRGMTSSEMSFWWNTTTSRVSAMRTNERLKTSQGVFHCSSNHS